MKVAIKILALVMFIFFFVPTFSTGCDYGGYEIYSDFDVLVQGENLDLSDYGYYQNSNTDTYEVDRINKGAMTGAQVYSALIIVCVLMAALPGTVLFKDNNVVQGSCACAAGTIGFIAQTGILSSLNRATRRNVIIPEGIHYFIIVISITLFVLGLCQAIIKKRPMEGQQPSYMYPQPMMYQQQYPMAPMQMVPVPQPMMAPAPMQPVQTVQPQQPQQQAETWSCYACGSKNPVTSGFCGNCGTKRGQ